MSHLGVYTLVQWLTRNSHMAIIFVWNPLVNYFINEKEIYELCYLCIGSYIAEASEVLPPARTPILIAFPHPPDFHIEPLRWETDEKATTEKGLEKWPYFKQKSLLIQVNQVVSTEVTISCTWFFFTPYWFLFNTPKRYMLNH